jgi:DNA-binding transcriptional ArsR family regulator
LRQRSADLDEAVDAVLATPLPVIRGQLAARFEREKMSASVVSLLRGQPTARRRLAVAIHAFHDSLVRPGESFAESRYDEHYDQQRRRLDEYGLAEIFTEMYPQLEWNRPVLRAHSAVRASVDLTGQGLILTPSVYADRPHVVLGPGTAAGAPAPPLVIYPVPAADDHRARSLSALLGATRAKVLRTLGPTGCSTSALAERLGITPGSASQHATVLRNAGLVDTVRTGRGAHHTLTALGFHLLATNLGEPAPGGCLSPA